MDGRRGTAMQRRSIGRPMREDEFDAVRVDRVLAWSMVAAVHAVLAGAALQLRTPASRNGESEPLAVIFLPAPAPVSLPPVAPAATQSPDAPKPSLAAASPSQAPVARAPSPVTAPPESGLIAVQVPTGSVAAPPRTTRAPWDEPVADAFERRAPALPGQGAQRFTMKAPRSVAGTIDSIGAMFGGRGEDPCARTRDNIGRLGVHGDSADLQREVEYERRHCRP